MCLTCGHSTGSRPFPLDQCVRAEFKRAVETSNFSLVSSKYDYEDATLLSVWAREANADAEVFFQLAVRFFYGFKGVSQDLSIGAGYLQQAVDRGHPSAIALRVFLSTQSTTAEKLYALKFARMIWKRTKHVFTGVFYAMHICEDSHTAILTGKPMEHYATKAYDTCERIISNRRFEDMNGLELLLFEVEPYVETMTRTEFLPLLSRAVTCLQSTRAGQIMNHRSQNRARDGRAFAEQVY